MKPKKQKTPLRRPRPKITSIYFCPRCRSKDVGYTFALRNLFGVIPTISCRKCNFKNTTFPQLVVTEKKLKQLEEKMKKSNKAKPKPKTKKKLLCPECWSDNIVPGDNWSGQSPMRCKKCGYSGTNFLDVETKKKRKKT